MAPPRWDSVLVCSALLVLSGCRQPERSQTSTSTASSSQLTSGSAAPNGEPLQRPSPPPPAPDGIEPPGGAGKYLGSLRADLEKQGLKAPDYLIGDVEPVLDRERHFVLGFRIKADDQRIETLTAKRMHSARTSTKTLRMPVGPSCERSRASSSSTARRRRRLPDLSSRARLRRGPAQGASVARELHATGAAYCEADVRVERARRDHDVDRRRPHRHGEHQRGRRQRGRRSMGRAFRQRLVRREVTRVSTRSETLHPRRSCTDDRAADVFVWQDGLPA